MPGRIPLGLPWDTVHSRLGNTEAKLKNMERGENK